VLVPPLSCAPEVEVLSGEELGAALLGEVWSALLVTGGELVLGASWVCLGEATPLMLLAVLADFFS